MVVLGFEKGDRFFDGEEARHSDVIVPRGFKMLFDFGYGAAKVITVPIGPSDQMIGVVDFPDADDGLDAISDFFLAFPDDGFFEGLPFIHPSPGGFEVGLVPELVVAMDRVDGDEVAREHHDGPGHVPAMGDFPFGVFVVLQMEKDHGLHDNVPFRP